MAPHNNAPSPADSFTAGFDRVPFHASSALSREGHMVPANPDTPLSSSYGSNNAMMETADLRAPQGIITRPLAPGVYAPTMCFFEAGTENVDTETIARHAVRLARAGVTGLATQGSNGEAVHLTHAERQLVTATTRKALDEAGFAHMPIIVGCGAQSTRETVQHCCEAWEAGGDYALVLPPAYYASLFAPGSATVTDFFTAVADASPIPLVIYNFPGAVGGLDLSSDVIVSLAAHPNIAGVKLTCGNTGKLNRVVAATRSSATTAASSLASASSSSSSSSPSPTTTTYGHHYPEFLVLAGSADFALPSLAAGGHGILAGLANLAPRACVQTVELYRAGKHEEALAVQEVVSRGDWTAIQGGVVGVKAGLQAWLGYGGHARSPLPKPTPEQLKRWKEGFRELFVLEKTLL